MNHMLFKNKVNNTDHKRNIKETLKLEKNIKTCLKE